MLWPISQSYSTGSVALILSQRLLSVLTTGRKSQISRGMPVGETNTDPVEFSYQRGGPEALGQLAKRVSSNTSGLLEAMIMPWFPIEPGPTWGKPLRTVASADANSGGPMWCN